VSGLREEATFRGGRSLRDCVVDFICHKSALAVEADRDIHDLQKKKEEARGYGTE